MFSKNMGRVLRPTLLEVLGQIKINLPNGQSHTDIKQYCKVFFSNPEAPYSRAFKKDDGEIVKKNPSS